MAERLQNLVEYMNRYLDIASFHDTSENGLQVEGSGQVEKVGVAVDACLESILKAVETRCQLLMVHHGLFWGEPIPLRGIHYKRIRALVRADMALYASHLPLDAHPQVGNNIQIAERLPFERKEPFGHYAGACIGIKGFLPSPIPWQEAMALCRKAIGPETHILSFGPARISCAGIVSGSASDPALFRESAENGIELLITGEPKEAAYYLAQEYGMHVFYGGHYRTETFGIRALGKHIADRFGLQVEFVDTACPI